MSFRSEKDSRGPLNAKLLESAIGKTDLNELTTLLRKILPPDVKAYLYGSRPKGNHRPFSDLDLALEGKMDLITLATLEMSLEESDLPFIVEVHRLSDLDPEFLKMIQGDFVEIF